LVALAELALNRAELLTKHRFSLIAAELPPNLLTELLLELPASLGLGDELRAQMEPRRDVQSEEDLDLSLRIDVETRSDAIGEGPGAGGGGQDLREHLVVAERHEGPERLAQLLEQDLG